MIRMALPLLIPPLVLSLGCATENRRADRAKPAGAPPLSAAWTGAVSEEEFKALHKLKEGEAPAPRGTMITIGGERAYLSLPANAVPPLPAIVVVHEWWGLNEHIEHWADRLAADGYAALAVDLYHGTVAHTPDEAMAAMKRVDPAAAMKTLENAVVFLRDAPTVKARRRAVIGWCFGGGWSLQLGLAEPDLNAVIMYYGRLVTDPAELARLNSPLLAVFGNEDKSIPPADVNRFEKALKEAGRTFEIYRYDAPHAFANPSNPQYNETAAADAWNHVREFLARYMR